MSKPKLIILEGNVGVGKTTTADILSVSKPDWVIFKENYAAECPYLEAYYKCVDEEECVTLSGLVQSWIFSKSISLFEDAVRLLKQGKTVVMDRSVIGMMPFVVVG